MKRKQNEIQSTMTVGEAKVTINGKTYTRLPHERHIHEVGTAKYSGPVSGCTLCRKSGESLVGEAPKCWRCNQVESHMIHDMPYGDLGTHPFELRVGEANPTKAIDGPSESTPIQRRNVRRVCMAHHREVCFECNFGEHEKLAAEKPKPGAEAHPAGGTPPDRNGFIPCEFGCGGFVHPSPSDPRARQAIWNHVCLGRVKKLMEEFKLATEPVAAQALPEREAAIKVATEIVDQITKWTGVGTYDVSELADFILQGMGRAMAQAEREPNKVFLLIDETAEGDYAVGIYTSTQKAAEVRKSFPDHSEMAIREYALDDPETHKYVRIYDPR
jgi:hypothetical protein